MGTIGTPQITSAQVRQAYADLNGAEAASEVHERCYLAAAHYANMNDYDNPEDAIEALDVLRLVHDNEFQRFGFYLR